MMFDGKMGEEEVEDSEFGRRDLIGE